MRICTRFHTSKRWFSRQISEKSTVAICTIGASAVGDDKHPNITWKPNNFPMIPSWLVSILSFEMDIWTPITRAQEIDIKPWIQVEHEGNCHGKVYGCRLWIWRWWCQKNTKFGALVRKRTKNHRPVIENKSTLQGPNFHATISKKTQPGKPSALFLRR